MNRELLCARSLFSVPIPKSALCALAGDQTPAAVLMKAIPSDPMGQSAMTTFGALFRSGNLDLCLRSAALLPAYEPLWASMATSMLMIPVAILPEARTPSESPMDDVRNAYLAVVRSLAQYVSGVASKQGLAQSVSNLKSMSPGSVAYESLGETSFDLMTAVLASIQKAINLALQPPWGPSLATIQEQCAMSATSLLCLRALRNGSVRTEAQESLAQADVISREMASLTVNYLTEGSPDLFWGS